MIEQKLRALAKVWQDYARRPYQMGASGYSYEACATELLAILDAEGDGWRKLQDAALGRNRQLEQCMSLIAGIATTAARITGEQLDAANADPDHCDALARTIVELAAKDKAP